MLSDKLPQVAMSVAIDGIHIPWEGVIGMAKLIKRQWSETLYQPTAIVALGRGGLVPARLLAPERTPVYYCGVRSYMEKEQAEMIHFQALAPKLEANHNHILFVDDIWDTGQTFTWAKKKYPMAKYAALMVKKPADETFLDYFGLALPTNAWIHMPWENL